MGSPFSFKGDSFYNSNEKLTSSWLIRTYRGTHSSLF